MSVMIGLVVRYQCCLVKVICHVARKRNITLSCWVPIYRDRLRRSISLLFSLQTFEEIPRLCSGWQKPYLPFCSLVMLSKPKHLFTLNPLILVVFWKPLFSMLFSCDATLPPCSLAYTLRASQHTREKPLGYKYVAPTGLERLFIARCSLFV